MAALLLALVLALLLEQGSASEARIVNARAGTDRSILLAAAAASSAFAGIAGGALADMLSAEARLLFLAVALGFAAAGLLLSVIGRSVARRPAAEGPMRYVRFLAARGGENTLFTMGAVSAFTGTPVLAALGGAAGSFAALSAATLAGPQAMRSPVHRAVRAIAGILLLLCAMFTAAEALRLIA